MKGRLQRAGRVPACPNDVIAQADVGGHDDLDAGVAIGIGSEGKHVQLAEHLQLADLFCRQVLNGDDQMVAGKDRRRGQRERGFRMQ